MANGFCGLSLHTGCISTAINCDVICSPFSHYLVLNITSNLYPKKKVSYQILTFFIPSHIKLHSKRYSISNSLLDKCTMDAFRMYFEIHNSTLLSLL